MNIDPKVESWLRAVIEVVENNNHRAEVIATQAYASDALEKALMAVVAEIDGTYPFESLPVARAALAIARGDAP